MGLPGALWWLIAPTHSVSPPGSLGEVEALRLSVAMPTKEEASTRHCSSQRWGPFEPLRASTADRPWSPYHPVGHPQ